MFNNQENKQHLKKKKKKETQIPWKNSLVIVLIFQKKKIQEVWYLKQNK